MAEVEILDTPPRGGSSRGQHDEGSEARRAPGAPRKPARPVRVAALKSQQQIDIDKIDQVESTLRSEKRRRDANEGVEIARPDDDSARPEERYARELDRLLRAREQDDQVIESLKELIKNHPDKVDPKRKRHDPAIMEAYERALRANRTLAEVVCEIRDAHDIKEALYQLTSARLQELHKEYVKPETCVVCQVSVANVVLHNAPAASPHAPPIKHSVCAECAIKYATTAARSHSHSFLCPHCRTAIREVKFDIDTLAKNDISIIKPTVQDLDVVPWRNVSRQARFSEWCKVLRAVGVTNTLDSKVYAERYMSDEESRSLVQRIAYREVPILPAEGDDSPPSISPTEPDDIGDLSE